MQRRAAATYFVFFVVIGAAAFGLIQTTSKPQVSMSGQAYAQGDSVTLGGQTFEVSQVGGPGELSWTNESAVLTETIDNGSEVPVTDVTWENQGARHEATLEAGSTVPFNDSEYSVSINASVPSVTLSSTANASLNETFEVGDSLPYRGNETTVTAISAEAATLVWGNPYVLDVNNESVADPTNATFVETRDVSELVAEDPALYNETVTINGTRMVTYRANNTNVPVEEYFPPVERHTIAEGETLTYQGNETTVDAVTTTSVTLARPGSETNTITLTEGENFTVNGQEYFPFFPDDSSVKIFPTDERYGDYNRQLERIDSYQTRMLGLWGVADIAALAAIVLIATALLPVRG